MTLTKSAIMQFTLRSVIERFDDGGSTVNLCALDLTKAFDKINHHALIIF